MAISSAAGGNADDLFRLAMDNSAVGMCLVSPEGSFLRVNGALCDAARAR